MTPEDLPRRVRAVVETDLPDARETAGRHEYDGVLQDLSPDGVRRRLAQLGPRSGETLDDPHDEAHLQAFEAARRWWFADFQGHRRDPFVHLANLDLACYEREYAPAAERAAARRRHLAGWPDAVDAAVAALDRVPAPVAEALLGAARGLAAGVPDDAGEVGAAALRAHARFVDHLSAAARTGPPETSVGGPALARTLGLGEALDVDVEVLALAADTECDRLRELLTEACGRLDRRRPPAELVPELLRDHPGPDGVLADARELVAQTIAFTREHRLAPHTDGECLVGPAPESRRWAMAMMSWAAPGEPDAPSWYHVTPPDPAWPAGDTEAWLAVFSRTSLPAITVHEVSPGHFAHGRSLRRVAGPVRRTLVSPTFAEGWAHYAEEMVLEEGFLDGDPRYAVGVALEALVRVTRLAVSVGLHTAAMTVDEAAARFHAEAFLAGPAARSEAARGTFDVGYGRYTWGKLAVLDAREQARRDWGAGFSLPRLHAALLDLGSPPVGLLATAVQRG